MKKELKLAAIVLLILAHTINKGNAQVAGYMGKRFTIEYANYFSIALSPTAYSYDPPGLNTVHCLNLDYAIKPRTNFCISGQYLHSGISIPSESYAYPRIHYIGNKATGLDFKSINVGMGFKFFRKGSLAPLGKYAKLELLILIETVNIDKKDFVLTDEYNNPVLAYTGPTTFNYYSAAVNFTLGRQRVFLNKLVLDYGIRFGIAPALIGNIFIENSRSDLDQGIKTSTELRVLGGQLVNLHLGIGFLAF